MQRRFVCQLESQGQKNLAGLAKTVRDEGSPSWQFAQLLKKLRIKRLKKPMVVEKCGFYEGMAPKLKDPPNSRFTDNGCAVTCNGA